MSLAHCRIPSTRFRSNLITLSELHQVLLAPRRQTRVSRIDTLTTSFRSFRPPVPRSSRRTARVMLGLRRRRKSLLSFVPRCPNSSSTQACVYPVRARVIPMKILPISSARPRSKRVDSGRSIAHYPSGVCQVLLARCSLAPVF